MTESFPQPEKNQREVEIDLYEWMKLVEKLKTPNLSSQDREVVLKKLGVGLQVVDGEKMTVWVKNPTTGESTKHTITIDENDFGTEELPEDQNPAKEVLSQDEVDGSEKGE